MMQTADFLERLDKFESLFREGKGHFGKLRDLVLTLQDVESKEQFDSYQRDVIPRLIPLLDLVMSESRRRSEADRNFRDSDLDLIIMKILAGFQSPEGIQKIADCVKRNHKQDNYFWSMALTYYIKTWELAEIFVKTLDGVLPEGFLGVLYLDMLNTVARNDETFRTHPFSSPEGVARLKGYLTADLPEYYSYAVSAAAAIPFLPEDAWKKLLPTAIAHPDKTVQLEAMWAGAKLGDERSRDMLVEATKDCRYAQRAMEYLEELGLAEWIPEESRTEDFQILAEMASWLSHPNEYGDYPTELEILDKRTLYWPPAKEERTMAIVRYRYENWNEGKDSIGAGMVGSVTFSIFDEEDLAKRSVEELYAVFCAWEMDEEDYEKPETGLAILRKHNPGFGE